jgi:uncharacterized protein YceK
MKLFALAIVTAVACSGCATQTSGDYTKQDDVAKIQAVNKAARAQGVQVVWINMPQKVVRASGS